MKKGPMRNKRCAWGLSKSTSLYFPLQQDRDDERVDDQRLNQSERDDHRRLDLTRSAGIARDALEGRRRRPALTKRAAKGRNGDRKTRGDGEHRLGATTRGRRSAFFREGRRRREQRRKQNSEERDDFLHFRFPPFFQSPSARLCVETPPPEMEDGRRFYLVRVSFFMLFMRRRQTDVDRGEQAEHERLDKGDEEPEGHKNNRNQERHEIREDPDHEMISRDVPQETKRE